MASSQASTSLQPYGSRVSNFAKNAAARNILETMERKQSNLCVSVDVTKKKDLLDVVDAVGEAVIMVKTHIDIVEDFDMDLVVQLTALAKKHDFVIFEDRKFADIGNTVSLQYAAGVHKIASWSDITNAHLVPGTGIIDGLAKVGEPLGRGLLLLAEMSSKGTLAAGDYTRLNVEAAYNNESGFVMGFIAMGRVDDRYAPADKAKRDFLVLTPGVGLDVTGDGMGQQYRTPDEVVYKSGCDVIIVGRGIYGALTKDFSSETARQEAVENVRVQGKRYKEAGWDAYLKRIGQEKQKIGLVSQSHESAPNGHANGQINGNTKGQLNGSKIARDVHLGGHGQEHGCCHHANGAAIVKSISKTAVSECKPYRSRGVGVVFAYGSLIFKPPPHTIGRTVGYVKGYARRFAQSSNDHRGTPEQPGRVATLIRSSDWAKLITNDDPPEGDIVWGVAWTIDPAKEDEVRAYLDDREKNGYTAQSTPVYGLDEHGNETVLMDDALLYVGLPDNEAFVGPAKSLVSLADYIFSCKGPSGRNDDYVLKLATACRLLSPDVADSHLFTLERLLLELRAKHDMSMGIVSQADQKEVRNVV